MESVRLPDLETIRRFSIAVRSEHADIDDVIEALRADLQQLLEATGRIRGRGGRAAEPQRRAPAARPEPEDDLEEDELDEDAEVPVFDIQPPRRSLTRKPVGRGNASAARRLPSRSSSSSSKRATSKTSTSAKKRSTTKKAASTRSQTTTSRSRSKPTRRR